MHEASLMEEVLRLTEAKCRLAGATRIDVVRLRVGVHSGVVPEALEFAFEALKEGTAAMAARLEIERVSAQARCRACGGEFQCPDPVAICPRCGVGGCDLEGGRELELLSLEVG